MSIHIILLCYIAFFRCSTVRVDAYLKFDATKVNIESVYQKMALLNSDLNIFR